MKFTGSESVNKKWPAQNDDPWQKQIYDCVLGNIPIQKSGGCMSYAYFASQYVYGNLGQDKVCFDRTVNGIKSHFQIYADPGEQLRYRRENYPNGNWNWHSIVFLGEDQSERGFYYISYNGGRFNGGDYPDLFVGYYTYEEFASKEVRYYLAVKDTNSGIYTANNYVSKIIKKYKCPVDVRISYGNESLDSRKLGSSSFGNVGREGDMLIFTLDYHEDYDMEIMGTGNGEMTFVLEYYNDENELIDTRTFVKFPIEPSTVIQAYNSDPRSTFILYATAEGYDDNVVTWGANENETVYGPNSIYSSEHQGPPYTSIIEETPSIVDTPNTNSGISRERRTLSKVVHDIKTSNLIGGKITLNPKSAAADTVVTITAIPDDNYNLDNLKVVNQAGEVLKLTQEGNDKYSFIMPNSSVRIHASFVLISNNVEYHDLPFSDVPTNEWYYESVKYAYGNELMSGVSGDRFAPDSNVTRGMVVSTLHHMEGNPLVGDNLFPDVLENQWYSDAVSWASTNNIVSGYSNGLFGVDDFVTREQLAAIIYRYSKYKGLNMSEESDLGRFVDNSIVSDWAISSVKWAVKNGLISGKTGNRIDPLGAATRAEIAAILHTFYSTVFSA